MGKEPPVSAVSFANAKLLDMSGYRYCPAFVASRHGRAILESTPEPHRYVPLRDAGRPSLGSFRDVLRGCSRRLEDVGD